MKVRFDKSSVQATGNQRKYNYKQRRKLSKQIAKLANKGVTFDEIVEGDKVKLNYEKIIGREDYNKENTISQQYKEFVETHKDTIFTTVSDNSTEYDLFSLKESDVPWLFHPVDLIKVNIGSEANEENK